MRGMSPTTKLSAARAMICLKSAAVLARSDKTDFTRSRSSVLLKISEHASSSCLRSLATYLQSAYPMTATPQSFSSRQPPLRLIKERAVHAPAKQRLPFPAKQLISSNIAIRLKQQRACGLACHSHGDRWMPRLSSYGGRLHLTAYRAVVPRQSTLLHAADVCVVEGSCLLSNSSS